MTVQFKSFFGTLKSWTTISREAADFASQFAPDRLISISQSESPYREGVVTVWFWGNPGDGDS